MRDEHGHKRKRAFTKLPGNMAEWRKSFVSGLFRVSDARYMESVLYQSWSLHFYKKTLVLVSMLICVLRKHLFLIYDAVAIALHGVIT